MQRTNSDSNASCIWENIYVHTYGRQPVVLRLTDDDSDTPGAKNPNSLFFVKKSGKIRKIGFLDSWDQNKILNFLDFFNFFIYGQYFLYKPLFPSSQPSKTLKIKTARSKSTGVPTYSSFGPPGTCFSPVLWSKLPFFDLKLT